MSCHPRCPCQQVGGAKGDVEWDEGHLTEVFLRAGLGREIYRKEGRLFRPVDPPEPYSDYHPEKPSGQCLIWVGRINHKEYGVVRADKRSQSVHIVSYRLTVGPIPEGLLLGHLCIDHRSCANPSHVRPVSGVENSREGNNRVWPDEITNLAPLESCPRCGERAVVYVQARRKTNLPPKWIYACRSHRAEYQRSLHAGSRIWPGAWYRSMTPATESIVTAFVSTGRVVRRQGVMTKKTHCLRGHVFDEENTYINEGSRVCRKCSSFHRKAYEQRKAIMIRASLGESA